MMCALDHGCMLMAALDCKNNGIQTENV